MNIDKLKKDFIEILGTLDLDEPILTETKNFVSSYDGTNVVDFHIFFLTLFELLRKYKILQIKASGYDKIANTKVKYEKIFDDLQRRYKIAMETPFAAHIPVEQGGKPVED